MSTTESHHDEDAAHLASLGIKRTEFKRDMGLWANFSIGFTYLSPVVGIYSMFAYAIATAGPPMWWSFPIVAFGQMMVCLVFSEILSQYPVAGGIYPWARRLWGLKYAWLTGWMYIWALVACMAAVAYGAGPYVGAFIGVDVGTRQTVLFALVIILIATAINYMGTKALSWAAILGATAELVGSVVIAVWVLATHRERGLGALFDSYGTGDGNYMGAFIAAALIAMWLFLGFEACGDVAEEVPNPGRVIPKSMRRTIYIAGSSAAFLALAFTLGVTDIQAVISGKDTDPITTLLSQVFGVVGMKIVLAIVLISFVSCVLGLQAAASRLLFSYSRDRMLVGHRALSYCLPKKQIPPFAVALMAVLPSIIILISLLSVDALTKLVSFASAGIYVAFQLVVIAALRARSKGWRAQGPWKMGYRIGWVVNITALVYGVTGIINMCWPRAGADASFLDNYIVPLGILSVVGLGLVYMAVGRKPWARGDQPWADAIPGSTKAARAKAGGAQALPDESGVS